MRAVFVDRDGVICRNRVDHVKRWEEFEFLPGARAALAQLARLDLPVVVVTNQAIINRGLTPAHVVYAINRRMVKEIASAGGRIDKVYVCPHRPDEDCACRKPRSGLLRQAAHDVGITLSASYLIGDAWTDIEAGLAVGCQTFLVLTGRGLQYRLYALRHTNLCLSIVPDLQAAVTAIVRLERRLHGAPDAMMKPLLGLPIG